MKRFAFVIGVLFFFNVILANAEITVFKASGQSVKIEEKLSGLRFGKDRYDGESVGKIIAFLNKNKDSIIVDKGKGEVDKLYFRPVFDGNPDSGQARIFVQNDTASVRLQQVVYLKDNQGNRIEFPFEGAEINVYIKGLKSIREGVVNKGFVSEVNTSLINSSFHATKIELLRNEKPEKYKNTDLETRLFVLESIKNLDWRNLARTLYPEDLFFLKSTFMSKFLSDKESVYKVIKNNRENMEMLFTFDNEIKEYIPVFRLKNVFKSFLNIDLKVFPNNSDIVLQTRSTKHHVGVNIYTGSTFDLRKKKRRSGDSKIWKDKKVESGLFRQEDYDLALINLSKVVEYFKDTFSWNSYDNKGNDLNATVRFKGSRLFGSAGLRQNAAWAGAPYNQFLFGRGGDTLGDFLNAFDVIGHEYCHAIISFTAGLEGGGETGALNEHICDILGVGFEGDISGKGFDFKIGEKVVLERDQGLRDFLNPKQSFSQQPDHMDEVNAKFGQYCVPSERNDECGVHYSNGVMNKAVGKSIQALGWPRMKDLVFEVTTKKLRSSSKFSEYATLMINTCQEMSTFNELECQLIEENFNSVGVNTGNLPEDLAEVNEVDFDAQLCEVVRSTCDILGDNSSIVDLCKKCL